ncbi:hypothetical protein Acr_00g0042150 [Actinidia rufa]|uniref:DUF659 domain-containing protein n=1 Tax=Actinidia rufa TaxID=165716 RepID=A0A7J0DK05_9ERIC|nr:hypothetical protein Acr_00g0042150 [Actinidia rufa]
MDLVHFLREAFAIIQNKECRHGVMLLPIPSERSALVSVPQSECCKQPTMRHEYGPGMKPLSCHETRVTYLKKELAHTNDLMKDHRENWVKYGCSIMVDGWTDGRGRILINFLGIEHRYDIRDTIDLISLSNIDESNEWLCGRLDGESDENEELVFEDDALTWGVVARASGVRESSKQTRATTSRIRSKGSTSTLNTIHLIDEEEAGSEKTEDADEYKYGDKAEDVDLLVVDVEDDF